MVATVENIFTIYGVPDDERMFRQCPIILKNKYIELNYALSLAAPGELHLEFGVFKGRSISHTAKRRPDQNFFGFDSFEGLPEAWVRSPSSTYPAGYFGLEALPTVPNNVKLIKGFFPTLWTNG